MNKFCILAAGRGTRNDNIVNLHKALLPLENKPIISHIIDRLDNNVEIIIAVGYKSEQIISYIKAVYVDRKITFVEVDKYDGVGSGPGYSLLCCKSKLQEPFVFTSVDTLIGDDIDLMNVGENWLGVSSVEVQDSLNYCLVNGSKYLDNLYYGSGNNAYIGMAGIYEYDKYWKALEKHKILKDEYQVIHGFDGLEHIKLINFTWHDTGNNKAYNKVRQIFNNEVVANKSEEAIFIDKGKVVKYFNDSNITKVRVDRSNYLNGNVPNVTLINKNMYSYDYISGKLLSEIVDESVLNNFFDFCRDSLFTSNLEKTKDFLEDCKYMYEDKTKERLKSMIGTEIDTIKKINGIEVEPIKNLLNKIDWDRFYENAIPSCFHGDLQPENIIYNSDDNKFILIDWRERFGKSKKVGDIYYDLSKLYHALLINGNSILGGYYDCEININSASVNFYSKSNLIYFMSIFKRFCVDNKYDWESIELLGTLHYLNICTLYDNFQDGKYGKFLFLYGKYLLTKNLKKELIYI